MGGGGGIVGSVTKSISGGFKGITDTLRGDYKSLWKDTVEEPFSWTDDFQKSITGYDVSDWWYEQSGRKAADEARAAQEEYMRQLDAQKKASQAELAEQQRRLEMARLASERSQRANRLVRGLGGYASIETTEGITDMTDVVESATKIKDPNQIAGFEDTVMI